MRLKHRPWGDEFLKNHPELIKNRAGSDVIKGTNNHSLSDLPEF